MNKPKIVAYLKPTCGWSNGVRAVLKKYDLPYEDRDIINNADQRQEMIEKSGQMLSPCVEINGHMLARLSRGSDHGASSPSLARSTRRMGHDARARARPLRCSSLSGSGSRGVIAPKL